MRVHLTEDVPYTAAKEERQWGDLYVPEGPGPFPVVVVVHGGGWQIRHKGDMSSISSSIATHGFVVYNINYRFAPQHQHPAPVDDLEAAIRFLKENAATYHIDVNRIGLWGYSSGGHIVSYYALTRARTPELRVRAVVAGGAPFDFTWYPHSPYIHDYMGGYRAQKLDAYFEASPAHRVTKDAPPFFLYHGKSDNLLEYSQMQAFEAKLQQAGVYVKSHKVGWWGHSMTFAWPDRPVEKGVKFLAKWLK